MNGSLYIEFKSQPSVVNTVYDDSHVHFSSSMSSMIVSRGNDLQKAV